MSRLSGSNSTSTSHWGSRLVIAQLIYFGSMVGLGVFLPDSVLEGNAWKRDFSDFMASFVPQIDRITALDIKPGVNRFYFSILWATSPALFGLLFLNIYRTRSTLRKLWDTPLSKVLLSMCGLAMMLAWTQHLWFVEPSMRLSLFLFGTTIGRSFFSQLAFYIGAVFCIAALMVWCVGCLNGYISRNTEEKHHE